MATLVEQLEELAQAIAAELKSTRTLVNGNAADLSELSTTAKTSLVAAINEVAAAVGGSGASIDDDEVSTLTVWSSDKTDEEIDARIAAILDSAPSTLDTLNELAAALGDDPNFATTIASSIAGKADVSHTHSASNITSGTLDAARLPAASESAVGAVELATEAETVALTDATRVVTPATLGAVVGDIEEDFVATFQAGLL